MQSGVGKLSCNKTALKRCTSTETLWNRTAPSLSSPEDEEIFLPKLPKSWHADVLLVTIIIMSVCVQLHFITISLMLIILSLGMTARKYRVTYTARVHSIDCQYLSLFIPLTFTFGGIPPSLSFSSPGLTTWIPRTVYCYF